MAPVRLTTVTRTQGNNAALKSGDIQPTGFQLDFVEVPVLVQAFRRMVRTLEFDVCEMAITTYLCAKEHGVAFTALPIFLVRGFHHAAIVHDPRRPVRSPAGLEGQRVGVNRGYTVTTGVWARGILRDEYGVDLDQVTWVLSGDEHVEAYRPPPNVEPMPPGADLESMLLDGELAAVVGIEATHPDLAPLIADPVEAAHQALKTRGLYPINHLVVVRDELLERHPDLAVSVFDAFADAKRRYIEALLVDGIAEPSASDELYRQVQSLIGADPLPYGIGPNLDVIEMLVDYAMDQQILSRRPVVEELFAPTTQSLIA